jgi:hypothetical protein
MNGFHIKVVIPGAVRSAQDPRSRKKDRIPACAGMTRARVGSVLRHFVQLFPNHLPEDALQRSLLFLHVGTQDLVNERLIIAAFYLRPERGKHIIVEANRDALLTEREGDLDGSFELPSYIRTDALIGYGYQRWKLSLNVHNLLDRHYFAGGERTQIFPGEPLTVIGALELNY